MNNKVVCACGICPPKGLPQMVPPPGYPIRMVKIKGAFTAADDEATLANYKTLLLNHGKNDNWATIYKERNGHLRVHDYHFLPEAYANGRLTKDAPNYIRPMRDVKDFGELLCPSYFLILFFIFLIHRVICYFRLSNCFKIILTRPSSSLRTGLNCGLKMLNPAGSVDDPPGSGL